MDNFKNPMKEQKTWDEDVISNKARNPEGNPAWR